jgi:hypothetical protein
LSLSRIVVYLKLSFNSKVPIMRSIVLILILLTCTSKLYAGHFSNFHYLSDSETSPEGLLMGIPGVIDGMRVHTNGGFVERFHDLTLHGFWSQGNCESMQNFDNQILVAYDRVRFPDQDTINEILNETLPEHRYNAFDENSLPLTTWIKLDHERYHVAQYATELVSENDTSYYLPWQTFDMPQDPGLIWSQGVTRVQGIVAGQLTIASSDSLFITGDIITEDVILEPCVDPNVFGTVPVGSLNRIGLLGLGDIIVAATPSNGFGNGASGGFIECGFEHDPVITTCYQGHKDVVITAAILALGCSFEAEFWKTTATNAAIPPADSQSGCSGMTNLHATLFDCANSQDYDMRGTLWICGSLCMNRRGYVQRSPVGPWGNVVIGYQDRKIRYDTNLLDSPPPLWPEFEWTDDDPPLISISEMAENICGEVDDLEEFRILWNFGFINLSATINDAIGEDDCDELIRFTTWLDDEIADSISIVFSQPGDNYNYTPNFTLPANGDFSMHIEVAWDAQVWNRDGENCTWDLNFTDVEDPPSSELPHSIGLSVYPNPFNPSTQISLLLEKTAKVNLQLFDIRGVLIKTILEQTLVPGDHKFIVDGDDLSSGIYFLHLITEKQKLSRKILLSK